MKLWVLETNTNNKIEKFYSTDEQQLRQRAGKMLTPSGVRASLFFVNVDVPQLDQAIELLVRVMLVDDPDREEAVKLDIDNFLRVTLKGQYPPQAGAADDHDEEAVIAGTAADAAE